MKKSLASIITLITVLLFALAIVCDSALAETQQNKTLSGKDTTAPVIESVQANPKAITAPENATLSFDIKDDDKVTSAFYQIYYKTIGLTSGDLVYNGESDRWEAICLFSSITRAGKYDVYVNAQDASGNLGEAFYKGIITVTNPNEDKVPPEIGDTTITPDSIIVPGNVRMKASISDNSSVFYVFVDLLLNNKYLQTSKLEYNSVSGLWEGTINLKNTLRNATYSLNLHAHDPNGNTTNKNFSRILKVQNPLKDKTPPTVESITITPDVAKASETIIVAAVVTDNFDKTTHVSCSLLRKNKKSYGSDMQYNSKTKQWECEIVLPDNAAAGSYNVSIYAEDSAGNHKSKSFSKVLTVAE